MNYEFEKQFSVRARLKSDRNGGTFIAVCGKKIFTVNNALVCMFPLVSKRAAGLKYGDEIRFVQNDERLELTSGNREIIKHDAPDITGFKIEENAIVRVTNYNLAKHEIQTITKAGVKKTYRLPYPTTEFRPLHKVLNAIAFRPEEKIYLRFTMMNGAYGIYPKIEWLNQKTNLVDIDPVFLSPNMFEKYGHPNDRWNEKGSEGGYGYKMIKEKLAEDNPYKIDVHMMINMLHSNKMLTQNDLVKLREEDLITVEDFDFGMELLENS